MRTTYYCDCVRLRLWYVGDDGTRWCNCGHEAAEHIDGHGTCLGEIERI